MWSRIYFLGSEINWFYPEKFPQYFFHGHRPAGLILKKTQENCSQGWLFNQRLGASCSKSLCPASIMQSELTGNGFPHAAPSCLFTMVTWWTGTDGCEFRNSSMKVSGQLAATSTIFASPLEHSEDVCLWPKTMLPVLIPCFSCLAMSILSPQLASSGM